MFRRETRTLEPATTGLSLGSALVMSGGSINGIYLQLGFLKALRESDHWHNIRWVYGTSAGALSGWAAALDAIDEHERFLMDLQPADVFSAHEIWKAPLAGLHRYTLPETVAQRLGDPVALARRVKEGPRELTVVTTDIGLSEETAGTADPFERAFSSRDEDPETLVAALFASAAISMFVLPIRIGNGVYADGGWVRNFPLTYACRQPGVEEVIGCRYRPPAAGYPGRRLESLHKRLVRFDRLRVARSVTTELRSAIERHDRGEPMHLLDTIARLSHIAVYRNSELEVQRADEHDQALAALTHLHETMRTAIASSTRGTRRARLLSALDEAVAAADFPFDRDRAVPRLLIDVTPPLGVSLDIPRDAKKPWNRVDKLALIVHGRKTTNNALDRPAGEQRAA